MQLPQPLTLLYVALPSRQILRSPGIYQINLEPFLFQHIVNWNPVHSGGLHGYGFYPAGFQPSRHAMQILRPASELSYRLLILVRWYRHKVTLVPDIDTGCVRMHDRQFRRFGVELPLQLLALLTVQALALQPLESRFLSLRHGILPIDFGFCQARLGWRSLHNLSGGVELGPLQAQLATKYSNAATEVRLRDGHNGTKEKHDHSLPSVASFSMLRSWPLALGFPAHSTTNVVRGLELRVFLCDSAPPVRQDKPGLIL